MLVGCGVDSQTPQCSDPPIPAQPVYWHSTAGEVPVVVLESTDWYQLQIDVAFLEEWAERCADSPSR